MKLERILNQGLLLSDEELEELKSMYLSGMYYVSEILEYFGINYYQWKCYKELLDL